MYCLSFDIDWASDEVIQYCIEKVIEAELKATIFATHDSRFLRFLEDKYPSQIEIALHPNYIKFLNKNQFNWEYEIKNLKQIYPSSIGVRSHGHFVSSQLLEHYIDLNMKYESGIYSDNFPLLSSLPYTDNFVRFSHFFQDDAHLIRKRSLDLNQIKLKSKGIKIFDFHPIHIFLNSPSIKYYESRKKYYHDINCLKKNVYSGRGICNLFLELIKFLKLNKKNVIRLKDLI